MFVLKKNRKNIREKNRCFLSRIRIYPYTWKRSFPRPSTDRVSGKGLLLVANEPCSQLWDQLQKSSIYLVYAVHVITNVDTYYIPCYVKRMIKLKPDSQRYEWTDSTGWKGSDEGIAIGSCIIVQARAERDPENWIRIRTGARIHGTLHAIYKCSEKWYNFPKFTFL